MATTRKDFYYRLIPVLYAQIEQLPEEFFAENTQTDTKGCNNNNFISRAMNELIQTSLDPEVSVQIRRRVAKLQQLLVDKFGLKKVKTEEERVI